MKLLLLPVFLLKRTINLETQRERLTFLATVSRRKWKILLSWLDY